MTTLECFLVVMLLGSWSTLMIFVAFYNKDDHNDDEKE